MVRFLDDRKWRTGLIVAVLMITLLTIFSQHPSSSNIRALLETKAEIPEGEASSSIETTDVVVVSEPDVIDETSKSSVAAPKTESNGLFSLPPAYHDQYTQSEYCLNLYTDRYLVHLASNHINYCKPESSRSALECFSRGVDAETFCIARGVRTEKETSRPLNLHCDRRNLTEEGLGDQFLDIEDFPDAFFSTGPGVQLRHSWNLSTDISGHGTTCNAKVNDGKVTVLIRREGNDNIWHQLTQIISATLSLDTLQMAKDENGEPYLPLDWRRNAQVVIEDDSAKGPIWDFWGMLTGAEPVRFKDLPDHQCWDKVVLPIPGSHVPFWQNHWEPRDCGPSNLLDTFISRVFKHFGTIPAPRLEEKIVVTIIDRKKTRKILNLDHYVAHMQELYPNVIIQSFDFAQFTLREQIVIMQNTDVLVGVIGAGFTNLLWMNPKAAVAEIHQPEPWRYYGFRNLAKMRGMDYFSAHPISLEDWNERYDTNLTGIADWQMSEYVYLPEESWIALLEAAISSQLHRGHLASDPAHHVA